MIIGVVGFAGSGKGAVGEILVTHHGFEQESFAKSVKDAAASIFNWDRSLLEGDTPISREWREKEDAFWSEGLGKSFTPRLVLQLLGTEAGRDIFGQDLWVLSLFSRVDPAKNYVITDVRFPNEINAIRKYGGKIVIVKRGQEPPWYNDALTTNRNKNYDMMSVYWPNVHKSEWSWIGCDYDTILDNNCSLHELKKRVDDLIDSYYNNGVERNEVVNYETV